MGWLKNLFKSDSGVSHDNGSSTFNEAEINNSVTQAASVQRIEVLTLGGQGHGKSTLVSAIKNKIEQNNNINQLNHSSIEKRLDEYSGISGSMTRMEYEVDSRLFLSIDFDSNLSLIKYLLCINESQINCAILVISAEEGVTSQIREQLNLISKLLVPYIIVFLNKADIVEDSELLEVVEMEVREVIDGYTYPADDIPFIYGSASKALEGDSSDIGESAVQKLIDEMYCYFPDPDKRVNEAFLMPVEDVFSLSNSTVALGSIERGLINVGDEIEITGARDSIQTTCIGIEMYRKLLDQAQAGDRVGILLRNIKKSDIIPGQVLCKPNTVAAFNGFEAEIYVLTKDEGAGIPLVHSKHVDIMIHSGSINGVCLFPNDKAKNIMPGDHSYITIQLNTSTVIEEGNHFSIRTGKKTVGAGVITSVKELKTDYSEKTEWYIAESNKKLLKQIVIEIPSKQETESQFGMLMLASKYEHLTEQPWAVGLFRLDSENGPFLMVRADDAAAHLKGSAFKIGFSYFRMPTGGLFVIFVDFNCPYVLERLTNPQVVFEVVYGLDQDDVIGRIRELGKLDEIIVTIADGQGGNVPAALFDVAIPLPIDLKNKIQKEFEELLNYHDNIEHKDYQASVKKLYDENSQSEDPILSRSS